MLLSTAFNDRNADSEWETKNHKQSFVSAMKPSPELYTPSHPDFIVDFAPGEFASSIRAIRAFKAGDELARLEGLTRGPKAYTSVQCGPGLDDHVELNSDLVFVNHSCDPNVAFDLSSPDTSKWHLRAIKDIDAGSVLTFFYPSSEWDMVQSFDCMCRSESCLGRIQGAKYLSREELLARKWINPWILTLAENRDKYCAVCGHGVSASAPNVCGCKK